MGLNREVREDKGASMKYLSVVLLLVLTAICAQGQAPQSPENLSGTTWILDRTDKSSEATCIVFKRDGTVAIATFSPVNRVWSPYAYKREGSWKQEGASFALEFPDGNDLKITGTFKGDEMSATLSCSGEGCALEDDNKWSGRKQSAPPPFSNETRMISPKFLVRLPDGSIIVTETLKVSAP
jgi:hypothetical protein